jgi:2-(1,2-epoxy-1,2-dihydrophenyl)acetyl-CoA isomerase
MFIRTETDGGVARIILSRPDKFNSFNREMALELQAALDSASHDRAVRCILLAADGKAFCAGQDLAEAIDPSGPGITRIVTEHYNPIILRLRTVEKPVVCAVNGVAAGAGANIALACDLVIAGSSSAFIQAFSKIGLIPDSGGTFVLPRLVGWQRAAALMMTGEKIDAQQAADMGMIYKVVADEKLADAAAQLAQQLAAMPTRGLALTKRLLNESVTHTLEQQLQREAAVQAEAGQTKDFSEGVKAFLEKRPPVFRGE